jgi:flagellar assembly protein FliH
MRIEMFEYAADPNAPPLPEWVSWAGETTAGLSEATARGQSKGALGAAALAEFEPRLAEETRRSFEAGRERGRTEGSQAERDAQAPARAAAEQQRMRQTADLIARFAQERDRYMHSVEPEVVALALAVATRILRREAQMDPLLLTGAVRVALGQLSGSTQVTLRVPPAELDLWTEAIALLPNLAVKPSVVGGEKMRLGECVIETEMGSVDLGIRSQLGEIERGFFDRASGHQTEPSMPDLANTLSSGRESR